MSSKKILIGVIALAIPTSDLPFAELLATTRHQLQTLDADAVNSVIPNRSQYA